MRIYKLAVTILLCVTICGCASLITKKPKVILMPEERIFTIPAGQTIPVVLDKKPVEMTFPQEMKVVSPTVLVRQEEKLNNAMLEKVKANKEKQITFTIIGSILGILAAGLGIFFKMKKWAPNVKANVEIK